MKKSGSDAVNYFDPMESCGTTVNPNADTAIQRQIAAAAAKKISIRTEVGHRGRVFGDALQRHKAYRKGLALLATAIVLMALFVVSIHGEHNVERRVAFESVSEWFARATGIDSDRLDQNAQAAISIPLQGVSLNQNPQLFEQLVQFARATLRKEPGDKASLSTLNTLREQALTELEGMAAERPAQGLEHVLVLATRLFPEFNSDPRYLAVQINSEKSSIDASASSAAAYADYSTGSYVDSNRSETTVGSRPISGVTVRAGVIVGDQFVPREKGNIFSVSFDYKNLRAPAANEPRVTLIAQLGYAGESTPFAEVPVDVAAGNGSANFLIGTLLSADKAFKYHLNFVLDNELLVSETVRLAPSLDTRLGFITKRP